MNIVKFPLSVDINGNLLDNTGTVVATPNPNYPKVFETLFELLSTNSKNSVLSLK